MPSIPAADPSAVKHGPINRASQVTLETAVESRMPGRNPSVLSLFVYIQGAGRHADALLSNLVRDRGLDGSQLTILFTLWCVEPPHRLSPTALHRLLVQSPSGVSHALRRLQASGLVRRAGDEADGRARHVELTAKGERMVESCMAELADALDAVLDGVSAPQVKKLADSQRRVAELLSASPLSYPVTSRPASSRGAGDT